MSEYIALKSAAALEDRLKLLHQQYGANVYLFAHSHGNVVVGEALRKAAGDKAVALIKRVDDPFVSKIVQGWAGRYDAKLASSLGFKAEKNFDEIIKVYQEDEMGL